MNRALLAALLVLLAATGGVAAAIWPERTADLTPAAPTAKGSAPLPAHQAPADAVRPRFERPPAAGVLFDVDSGEVLWSIRAQRRLPIASLTKLMTALIVSEESDFGDAVLISAKPPRVEGSGIGLLEEGQRVSLRTLFFGLIMVSGNDAAAALAEHHSGTIAAFVAAMNRRARELGLACTRFAGPSGLQDRGNHSCAADVASLARLALADPRIAKVAAKRFARAPFPSKSGVLELANNHFFAQRGIRGLPSAEVTGLKTGYTDAAGRCYVTTARLHGRHLGVVLLDSEAPLRQVPVLLRAGFGIE